MQSVSNDLKAALNRQNPVYSKSITLYRRVWTGSAYVFEDTPIDITNQVTDAGRIMWKFDKEGFNVWSLSNTTLTLRNDRQQWKQDNPKGYFPSGYLLHGSKVTIRVGAQLVDGIFERPYVFTGRIKTDPVRSLDDKSAVITLEGSMSIFSMFNAEDISTPVTNEEHAYSAPGIVDYATLHNGAAAVGLVVKRGATTDGASEATEIKPVVGYSISDQNTKSLPLKVTLVSALTATESLWFTYKYWYQDKTLEWIVAQVCALCGVTSTAITPAVFHSSIENTWDFNSQADWDTCTKSNIDTITVPGAFKIGVLDDFTDDEYSSNPAWETHFIGGSTSVAVVSKALKITLDPVSGVGIMKLGQAAPATSGTWQFQVASGGNAAVQINFIALSVGANYPQAGYAIYKQYASSNIHLVRVSAGNSFTYLISAAQAVSLSDVVTVTRTSAGAFELFINGISKGTATDTTHSTSDGLYFCANRTGDGSLSNIYHWDEGTTIGAGVLTSPIRDASASIVSWGKLAATYTANGATVAIETYTSDSSDFSTGNDAAGWIAVDGAGQILSAVKRYIKYRITASLGSLVDPVLTPSFDEISIKYYTSTTLIDLVDLTGLKCDSVLNTCAMFPCYEMGFNAADVFIYRPRSTTLPAVIELRSSTNIVRLQNVVDGVDRVKNRVIANFGIYTAVADTTGDIEPTSKTKYGDRDYTVPSSSLLPPQNVNIAYAIAPTILAYTKDPRRRCQAVCKSLPYLELGDIAKLYFNEPTAFRIWKWGDTDVSWDDPTLEYYGGDVDIAARVSFWGVEMRIEGIEFDYWGASPETGWQMILDLTEAV